MTAKTLQMAIDKIASLPAQTQEQIAREILERVESEEHLRAELDIGLRQLDAGLGEPLDIEDLIKDARIDYAAK